MHTAHITHTSHVYTSHRSLGSRRGEEGKGGVVHNSRVQLYEQAPYVVERVLEPERLRQQRVGVVRRAVVDGRLQRRDPSKAVLEARPLLSKVSRTGHGAQQQHTTPQYVRRWVQGLEKNTRKYL